MSTLRQVPWAAGVVGLSTLAISALSAVAWGLIWLLDNTWLGDVVLAVVTWAPTPIIAVVLIFIWLVARTRAEYLCKFSRSRPACAPSTQGSSYDARAHQERYP